MPVQKPFKFILDNSLNMKSYNTFKDVIMGGANLKRNAINLGQTEIRYICMRVPHNEIV